MALQQFIVSVGFVFIQRAVNSFGEAMTASFTAAQKIETYMILPANALMTTQVTYTGQNIGAHKPQRIISGAKDTILISEIISAAIATAAFIFAEPVAAFFVLSSLSLEYCTAHIKFVACSLCVFAAYFPILGLFQGANDALYSTLVATVALTVRVASTYLLMGVPQISYNMIWANAIVGWGAGFIITWVHFKRGKWKNKYLKALEEG